MFGKATVLGSTVPKYKIHNSNVWTSQNTEMKIMIEKVKIENSNVWDSQNGEFQWSENKNLKFKCMEKAKIKNSNV